MKTGHRWPWERDRYDELPVRQGGNEGCLGAALTILAFCGITITVTRKLNRWLAS